MSNEQRDNYETQTAMASIAANLRILAAQTKTERKDAKYIPIGLNYLINIGIGNVNAVMREWRTAEGLTPIDGGDKPDYYLVHLYMNGAVLDLTGLDARGAWNMFNRAAGITKHYDYKGDE